MVSQAEGATGATSDSSGRRALWRKRLVFGCATGFVAGTYWAPSEWWLWRGAEILVIGLLFLGWGGVAWRTWRSSWLLQCLTVFLLWMMGRSCLVEGVDWMSMRDGLWGGLGLLLLCIMLVEIGGEEGARDRLGAWVVLSAAGSALISLIYAVAFEPDWVWGRRLQNVLVYGGWNAVCSGLTYAMAAVWASALCLQQKPVFPGNARLWAWAHGLLVWASVASLSRGALLVLVAGHGALWLSGRTSAWKPTVRAVAVILLFHLLVPQLARWERHLNPDARDFNAYTELLDNPLQEWSKRGDTGRIEMYQAIGRTRQGSEPWIGTGLWSDDRRWVHLLEEEPNHPHSAWVATWLHGGWIGLALFGGTVFAGCVVALRSGVRRDFPVGLALWVAGSAAVVFDGESVASLATMPRFEPLLLWVPFALLAGAGRRAASRGGTD